MSKIKNIAYISVIVAVVLIGAGFGVKAFSGNLSQSTVIENFYGEIVNEAPNVQEDLGAGNYPHHYGEFSVHGRFSQGGGILQSITSATTTTNVTLTTSQIRTYSQVDVTPTYAAITLTLPATSTISGILDTPGECMSFKVRNVSATSASTTTITAGTGIDLVENENGDVVIEGGNEAQLIFCKELDTDITVSVDEYIAAD